MFGRATIRLGIGPHSSYDCLTTDSECIAYFSYHIICQPSLRFLCTLALKLDKLYVASFVRGQTGQWPGNMPCKGATRFLSIKWAAIRLFFLSSFGRVGGHLFEISPLYACWLSRSLPQQLEKQAQQQSWWIIGRLSHIPAYILVVHFSQLS